MGASDAFFLTLCKPSKDCRMITPKPIKGPNEKELKYRAVQAKGIKLDGNLADWKDMNFIDLGKSGNVKIWMYDGAKDLSGKFALCWDDKNLYLGAEIVDDVPAYADSADSLYMGDSIQLAILQEAAGKGWFEISLGNLKNGKGQAYCFISPSNDHPTGVMKDVRVNVRRDGTNTIYEVAIPLKTLAPINPKNAPFFFSLLVNDNDGAGRMGWVEWGGGIGDEKTPSKFKECIFVP